MESEDGWVTLGEVGKQLANLASDFDPRTYGFRKLSDLVKKTDAFDIEQEKGGSVRIRRKVAAEAVTSAAEDRGEDHELTLILRSAERASRRMKAELLSEEGS